MSTTIHPLKRFGGNGGGTKGRNNKTPIIKPGPGRPNPITAKAMPPKGKPGAGRAKGNVNPFPTGRSPRGKMRRGM